MQTHAAAARVALDRFDSRVEAAMRLRAKGRPAEALELLSGPGDDARHVYTLRGDLQMELGQFHKAVGSYSTAVALNPENLHAHRSLAGCLHRLERWDTAADAFRKILEHDPSSDAARIGLGECLLHLNKPEQALACFEACRPEALVPALFGRAAALLLLRRFDESEALFVWLLELQPESEEALSNLIALSMETFDLARVQHYAEQLLKPCPRSIIALQALTLVAFERRLYENAAEYYDRLLQIAPEHKLIESGDEDALEYRLSPKNIQFLKQFRADSFPRTHGERH
jgi:tetratricopeptide (TPR) repeat protein